MRLTRFGFHSGIFYLVMVGAFFAAPYSNLFFLLLGFLTLLLAFGLVGAWRNLRGVGATLVDLRPVASGSPVQVPLELDAPRPTRFHVGARLELADGQALTGRVDLLEESATLTLESSALPRGCYVVERAELESSHPFGLFRMRRGFEAPSELVVYPSPRALLEGRSSVEALDDLLGRADPGAGDLQPSSLRDHREGDGVRRIHWRASARRDRLVVQEWEGASGNGLEVVLDRRCTPDELEESLETISAMVHLARTNKETLRLHSQDLSATFGESQRPWPEALRFLASTQALPDGAPPPPVTSPTVARLPRALAQA